MSDDICRQFGLRTLEPYQKEEHVKAISTREYRAALRTELSEQKAASGNAVQFLETVRKYSDISELNAGILNDLIDRIVVCNAEGPINSNKRTQRVGIYYKFIGALSVA